MTEWNSAQQAGRFVEAYADAILRLCLTYSLTREDAQDICQDIFLKLLEENRQSFVLQNSWQHESVRGKTTTIKIGSIEEHWSTVVYTDDYQHHAEAILDHEWVFEDVKLNFPDQTIRLEPNVVVPWIGGTTTVTKLEVSPLSIRVELEGGTCADYRAHANGDPFAYDDAEEGAEELVFGDIVMTFGTPSKTWQEKLWEMEESMTLDAVLKDGTTVSAIANVGAKEGTRQGVEGPETTFVSWCRRYSLSSNGPAGLVDPAQVDHVTVCGVDIPMDLSAPAPVTQSAAPEVTDSPEEAAPTVGTVTAGKGLNVRSGPGTQYKVVGGLKKDAQVTILGEENGFYQITCSEDQIRYVSKAYVSVG